MKKNAKRIIIGLLVLVLLYALRYAWISFPIISGYGAKNLCSCIFVSRLAEERVKAEELGSYPLSLASLKVDYADSSVIGTVWGLAKQKAIYRQGLGCTLINDISEPELRAQQFALRQGIAKADNFSSNILPGLQTLVQTQVQEKNSKGQQATRSLLVIHDSVIVGEAYAAGISKETKLLGWSMAKSVTAAMIGVLVKQGLLDPEQKAPVPQWIKRDDDRNEILLKNILQQTSGLDFVENYTKSCDVTKMLFQTGDMAAYTASRPLQHPAGTVFNYSSGNSNLLSYIIRKKLGDERYYSWWYDSLLYPAGMYHALIEPDASGTLVGSSFIYASTRDYGRFGLLYLNNGNIDGKQILPADWVQKSITPFSADHFQQYGYQFWLNGKDEKDPTKRVYPSAPADLFYADGVGGQRIFIIPSKKLVIVRMGFEKIDLDKFLAEVLRYFP